MCQSSFSLLVVIAKIATCFPQHWIPHIFFLLKVSVYLAEGRDEKLYFVFWNIFTFPLYIWIGESEHVHSPVAVPLEILVTPSLIDTSQWDSAFQHILQPPSSLRAPLKVGCVPDETHKTVPVLANYLLSFDCGELNVPRGLLQVLMPRTGYCDGPLIDALDFSLHSPTLHLPVHSSGGRGVELPVYFLQR